MIALLVMPIVIAIIMSGNTLQLIANTVYSVSRDVLADGEYSTMTWCGPNMGRSGWWGKRPRPLPPEKEGYVS